MRGAFTTPAIVLRSAVHGESDRILSLLSRTEGRLSAVARGARKSVRRFGGGLGSGAEGEATLQERNGAELLLLEAFELREGRVGLGADLGRTAHSAYVLELCERLCAPRQREEGIYDLLSGHLARLEAVGADVGRLRAFELQLLGLLGIQPRLGACARCGRSALAEETTRWLPVRGGVHCWSCADRGRPLPAAARAALVRLAAATAEEAEIPLDRALNDACRDAIAEVMSEHLTSPLRSLEFIRKMSRGTKGPAAVEPPGEGPPRSSD